MFRLMNKLQPGAVAKICTSGGGFKLRENVSAFQNAARAYGLPDAELFQTVDLFEKRNIAQVTQCIHALGRQVINNHRIEKIFFVLLGTEEEFQWTNTRPENVRKQCSRIHRRTTTCRTEYGWSTQRWNE